MVKLETKDNLGFGLLSGSTTETIAFKVHDDGTGLGVLETISG